MPGQIVLLDEASGASWQKDPQGRGKIWAAADWRVVWQKHDPAVQFVDDFAPEALPTTPKSAGSWFSRPDRPTAEIKEIASVAGIDNHLHDADSYFLSSESRRAAIPLRTASRHAMPESRI